MLPDNATPGSSCYAGSLNADTFKDKSLLNNAHNALAHKYTRLFKRITMWRTVRLVTDSYEVQIHGCMSRLCAK